ncbi:MAG: hypothetical protein M0C28_21180 [Candidatus Moduliflexus flocculans]|nr:hypothetical protein [Candidatus Moduliflexus flocculans]
MGRGRSAIAEHVDVDLTMQGLQHHPEPGAQHDHLPHEPLRPGQPQAS